MCVYVCTDGLDCVGAGGPHQNGDSGVLLVGQQLEADLVGGGAEGHHHLPDATGEGVPEGQ